MSGASVGGFFAELSLQVKEDTFSASMARLNAFREELKSISSLATEVQNNLNSAFKGFKIGSVKSSKDSGSTDELQIEKTKLDIELKKGRLEALNRKAEKDAIKDKKDSEEAHHGRLKEQNNLLGGVGNKMKGIVAAWLSLKGAVKLIDMAKDVSLGGQKTIASAARAGMEPKQIEKWANAASIAGVNSEELVSTIADLNTSFTKMIYNLGGNNKFLEELVLLGVDIKDWEKASSEDKARRVLTAGESLYKTGNPEKIRQAQVLLDQLGPGLFNLIVGSQQRGGVSATLNRAENLNPMKNKDYSSLAALGTEFGETFVILDQIAKKFITALGDAGLTKILKGFNDWYVKNKDPISTAIEGFSSFVAGVAKVFSDFIATPIGETFRSIGVWMNRSKEAEKKREEISKEQNPEKRKQMLLDFDKWVKAGESADWAQTGKTLNNWFPGISKFFEETGKNVETQYNKLSEKDTFTTPMGANRLLIPPVPSRQEVVVKGEVDVKLNGQSIGNAPLTQTKSQASTSAIRQTPSNVINGQTSTAKSQ